MHTEEMLPKQVTGKVQVNILMKITSNVIFPQYCIIWLAVYSYQQGYIVLSDYRAAICYMFVRGW